MTGFSRVFRNEGRNLNQLSRLREYGIRELVYVSNAQNVEKMKWKILDCIKEIFNELNLLGKIKVATDKFFDDNFSYLTSYQLNCSCKLEVNLPLSIKEKIACASINDHSSFMSKYWDLAKTNRNFTNSLCVGFGIERWCYATLCQYGINKKHWPSNFFKIFHAYIKEE